MFRFEIWSPSLRPTWIFWPLKGSWIRLSLGNAWKFRRPSRSRSWYLLFIHLSFVDFRLFKQQKLELRTAVGVVFVWEPKIIRNIPDVHFFQFIICITDLQLIQICCCWPTCCSKGFEWKWKRSLLGYGKIFLSSLTLQCENSGCPLATTAD